MRLLGLGKSKSKKDKNPKNFVNNGISPVLQGVWQDNLIWRWEDIFKGDVPISMKIAAVYRCVDLLSNYLSMLPYKVINKITNETVDDGFTSQIKYLLNTRPNKNMTPKVFFKAIEKDRLLQGNGFVEIIRANNGVITSLEYLQYELVELEKLDNGEVIYHIYEDVVKRRKKKLLSGEVLHFKGISDDGLVGKSVLSFACESIALLATQEKFNSGFYKNDGILGNILETDTDLSSVDHKSGKSLKDVMRDSFEAHMSRGKGTVKTAVLDRGMKHKSVTPLSHKDMAFVESKEVSIADIARFFGVPLHKLFTGKESYQSNEAQRIDFVVDTIIPIVVDYQQEITYKTVAEDRQRAGIVLRANLKRLLQGDTQTQTAHYKDMWSIGVYNEDDIRALEDMPRLPDGIGELNKVSRNYMPLKDFEEQSRLQSSRNVVEDIFSDE